MAITIRLTSEAQRLAMRSALAGGIYSVHKRENATKNPEMVTRLAKERVILLRWQRLLETGGK